MTRILLAGALAACLLLAAPAALADPLPAVDLLPVGVDVYSPCVGYEPTEYPYVFVDPDCIST